MQTPSEDNLPTSEPTPVVDDESISPTATGRIGPEVFEEITGADTFKVIQSFDYNQPEYGPKFRNRFVSASSDSVTLSRNDGLARMGNIGRYSSQGMRHSISGSMPYHSGQLNDAQQIPFDTRFPGLGQRNRPMQIREEHNPTEDPESDMEHPNTETVNIVDGTVQQLQQTQLREILCRLPRFVPRNHYHQPDAALINKFQASIRGDLGPMAWLRIAVWWLLKARKTLGNCDRQSSTRSRGSLGSSTLTSSTSHQAYVDLLKASYILYDIVLCDEGLPTLLTLECRKLMTELSEAINESFSQFVSVDIPDYSAIHSRYVGLQEPEQPGESPSNKGKSFSGLENARWITVELEDAGEEDERVLFRTFINAVIGGKTVRMWTKDAPYMLLLSTRDGETEPKITICNQSGTLCLQRDFEPADLRQLTRVFNASLGGGPDAKISEPLDLKFDHRSISVSFQYAADLMEFIRIPKAYFAAVSLREPVDSDHCSETVLFRGCVELYEQLRAPVMRSTYPPTIYRSCEVRILERSSDEAWRATRRLVISLSAAERNPRCMEYFMPPSQVQINRDGDSCEVQAKWSDTSQEQSTRTDGNYHPLYSYVYDAKSPNIGIRLRFRAPKLAEEFENAALGISFPSIFSWKQAGSSGHIYDVVDADQKQYKAIALNRGSASWRYCDLFYLYRDSDYAYGHSHLRIRFPRLSFTNYVSTCVDQINKPDAPVTFSHCEKRMEKDVVVDFSEETTMRAFMSSLSSSYELIFSRRAISLTTKGKGMLGVGRMKSSKGGTEVQLWRKGNNLQLASRWDDHIADRWLTVSVPLADLVTSGHSNRVDFPQMQYSRGTVLNLASIMAQGPKDPNKARRSGPITITFANSRDQEEFVEILLSSTSQVPRYSSVV